jgi:hypothetical protein
VLRSYWAGPHTHIPSYRLFSSSLRCCSLDSSIWLETGAGEPRAAPASRLPPPASELASSRVVEEEVRGSSLPELVRATALPSPTGGPASTRTGLGVRRKWWWWTRRSLGRRDSTRSSGSMRRWTRGTRRSRSIASSPTPRSACGPRPTTPRPRSRGTAATPSAASRWRAGTRYDSATMPSLYAPSSPPSSNPSPWYALPSLFLVPYWI